MAGIKSFGIGVTVNAVAIGSLTDVSLSGVDVNNVDTTAHDSTGGWREFVGGLKDGGSIDLTGNFDESDVGQTELRDEQGNTHEAILTLSDGSTITCDVVVGGYNVGNPLDDKVEFNCSLKVTGAIVIAAAV